MKKVIIRGPALSQSGYGEHTRFVLRSLRSRPDLYDVYLINVNWGQTGWIWQDTDERRWIDSILHKTVALGELKKEFFDFSMQVTIPNEWSRDLAAINIGVTAGIETTKISPNWFDSSINMDKIIVVSEHAKFGFENTMIKVKNNMTDEIFDTKIDTPIEVVGYPVKNIKPAKIDLDLKHNFNFIAVGTWIPRKNMGNTIRWFVEEFYDQNVGLIVKTSLMKNCLQDREAMQNTLKSILSEYEGKKCEVNLLHGDLSDEEMTALYTHPKVKAFVSLSHGEGFGLPLFEAVYNGLPVIAPDWSGPVDFLYMPAKKGSKKMKQMFSSVSYDIGPVQKAAVWPGVIEEDSQWCFAKEWHYKKVIRDVYKNHGAALSKAKKLKKYICEEFSEEKMYGKMRNAVYQEESEEVENWLDSLSVKSFE
jgi:glycosyltransferase involved in cell wall biosynthesis